LKTQWAEDGQFPIIRDFIYSQFGKGAIQSIPGRILWLCSAPNEFGNVLLVFEKREVIAICFHLQGEILKEGKTYSVGQGVDLFVHPSWRRQGIASKILEMRLKKFDVSISTGQSPEMSKVYKNSTQQHIVGNWYSALFVKQPQCSEKIFPSNGAGKLNQLLKKDLLGY